MITIHPEGIYLTEGSIFGAEKAANMGLPGPDKAREGTMAHAILSAHNVSDRAGFLQLKFDVCASHDITYVGIIQSARASGLTAFPLPYVLTNCHNSLCAVGGTINEDDHLFGLSAARRYGGEYVPAHLAVIHQYMRERYAAGGRMVLASDSHTRYGPYGTLAVGEGGPELVKQLLNHTYDIPSPQVAAIWLEGTPNPGVGPQDVAIALIAATFGSGVLKNKILEFIGPGIGNIGMDFRNGIDVMTTETTCLSSIWETDDRTREELARFGRQGDYKKLAPGRHAYYDALVKIDLGRIKPMIALPFHPSRGFTIAEFREKAADMLHEVSLEASKQWGIKAPNLQGKVESRNVRADQGVIVGCSGGLFDNISAARDIVKNTSTGPFSLSVYPASQPMALALTRAGVVSDLIAAGVTFRSAFCGPCFGAGDVPGNACLSLRHATRNFPNREGSKPGEGQSAFVALMDARSIAATAQNGGVITAADEIQSPRDNGASSGYVYDDSPYRNRVYRGVGRPDNEAPLILGPGIADWPDFPPLSDNLTITVASSITDPVTTTDELIPSGETSSYRSNPYRLAEFTLSRKDSGYVRRAKSVLEKEKERRMTDPESPALGSAVAAIKPGDGSAREQAASCQRVLGGVANIATEYATKRYRSNLINWGILPFILSEMTDPPLLAGDMILLSRVRQTLIGEAETLVATLLRDGKETPIILALPDMTREERDIILAGCLINYYADGKNKGGKNG